jgi:hypothetical protein
MYTIGLFYAWDFLVFIIMSIAYVYATPNIIRTKNEYVLFFLKYLSLIFTLFVIIYNITANKDFTYSLFWLSILPALFIFHHFYKFKKIQKSQHLTFFLFFLSLFMIALKGMIVIAFLFSTM